MRSKSRWEHQSFVPEHLVNSRDANPHPQVPFIIRFWSVEDHEMGQITWGPLTKVIKVHYHSFRKAGFHQPRVKHWSTSPLTAYYHTIAKSNTQVHHAWSQVPTSSLSNWLHNESNQNVNRVDGEPQMGTSQEWYQVSRKSTILLVHRIWNTSSIKIATITVPPKLIWRWGGHPIRAPLLSRSTGTDLP